MHRISQELGLTNRLSTVNSLNVISYELSLHYFKEESFLFYGCKNTENICVLSKDLNRTINPKWLYLSLLNIWCEYSCTPRLRHAWTPDNPTLGQCSITAFLAQDIFGGKVLGLLRPDGNYHCFNQVQNVIFDLTSEQFGAEVLHYEDSEEQSRETHFARRDKLQRYNYLASELRKFIARSSARPDYGRA